MDPLNLKKLNAARRARKAVAHVIDLGDGRDRIVEEGLDVAGELGEALAKAFRSGKSGTVEADGGRLPPYSQERAEPLGLLSVGPACPPERLWPPPGVPPGDDV